MSTLVSDLIVILGLLVLVLGLTALALAFIEFAARQYLRARSAALIRQLEHLLERTPVRR